MAEIAWTLFGVAMLNTIFWIWRSYVWQRRFYKLRRVKAEEVGVHVATNIDRVMRGFGMTPQEDEFPEVIDER